MVYPTRERIGTIEDADVITIRQIKLKKEAIVLQRITGCRMHFTQRFCQLVAKRQPFVREVVDQRLP